MDVMTTKPVIASPEMSINACALLMREYDLGSVIIKNKDDELIGIVTEEDMVYKVIADKIDVDNPILDLMTRKVETIKPNEDIFKALMKMKDYDMRRLPVVDEQNKLMGLITLKDILKIQPQLFDLIVEMIDLREEQRKFRLFDSKGNLAPDFNGSDLDDEF